MAVIYKAVPLTGDQMRDNQILVNSKYSAIQALTGQEATKEYVANTTSGSNLISNHNFTVETPDDSQPKPDATPRNYTANYQVFSGWFADASVGVTALTYQNGVVNFTAGTIYTDVPKSGALAFITAFKASIAGVNELPVTDNVSFVDNGTSIRVSVAAAAVDVFSVKLQEGSVANKHETVENVTHSYLSEEYEPASNKRYRVSFSTVFHLINGDAGDDSTIDFSVLAAVKSIVETDFNNSHPLNEALGGGASYQILTIADYGNIPDGELIGGVWAGADHYIGGGTDYVAKYMPVNGVIDAEALGYYSGQNTGSGDMFEDATAVFNKVLDYAKDKPIKLQAKQNYYYAGSYGSLVAGVKRHIEIIGSGMPVLDRNPNSPWEYNRLIGGTRIRGYMSLSCTSASLREFGVDGAPEATNSWPYTWDALAVKTYDTARSNSCYLDKIIALGKAYDTPSHALIISGFNNTFATDCQGYSTWYGISVDMRNAVITNFIGGNNERNLVNLKSHQDTGAQGDRFNNTCSVTGVSGLNPTTQAGANFGTACVAIEADGTNLERVVVSDVASSGFTGSIDVTPFNGAVMTNVMISDVTGQNLSDPADLIPDVRVWAAAGGGKVQNLHLSNIQLQNVKYQAMQVKDVDFFSCDNFFANTGIGGIGVAPTINTKFVEIESNVLSASLDGFTLVNSFGLTGGTGQGAIAWNNPVAGNRKGNRMLCVNIGGGAPS